MIKKQIQINILLFLLFFITSFIISYVLSSVYCDEIWNFGFSYNISEGLIIYKDFNVLQTPLYFFIASNIINIFGKYLISIHILDSIVMALIGLLLYRKIKWKTFFILPLLMTINPNSYNLLCLLFLFLILNLLEKEDNELIIAFIVGLLFITKQNIGIMLLPILLFNKDKKNTLIMFMTPFIFLSIYLLIHGAFGYFIDQAFLGMLDFNNSNKSIEPLFLILEVLSILYLLFLLYKSNFKNKEIYYVLLFQIMIYPIIDSDHFILSFIPVYYIICKNIKRINLLSILFIFVILLTIISFPKYINISFDKDMFFLRSPKEYNQISKDIYKYFNHNINNVYSNNEMMYYTKIYYNTKITKYDFLISGNMGLNGSKKMFNKLDKHCKKNDCYFLIFKDKFPQSNEFKEHIINNYKKVDNLSLFTVYH